MKDEERIFHRDELRNARYSALADAEGGFLAICFAMEALGRSLTKNPRGLSKYKTALATLASQSSRFSADTENTPAQFTPFNPLFESVLDARNDAMHTGVHARHVTQRAIELCLGLEEAIMKALSGDCVANYMVKSVVTVESWQPVARARQIMLMHSFSFLPVYLKRNKEIDETNGQSEGWYLLSDLALVTYMRTNGTKETSLIKTIEKAYLDDELALIKACTLGKDTTLESVLGDPKSTPLVTATSAAKNSLWLITEGSHLLGVLSPFELM